ncbi:MAG TPA: FliH/SctL family protein [Syntrophorhabdaceae bacterium]|nr:FliH/SctL family protein [Syntrophorhabdaceae bacterium]
MKPFIFNNLNDDFQPESKNEFTAYFEENASREISANRSMTIEERTRSIFEDAFAEGEKAGRELGMKKVDPIIKRLNSYISELTFFKEDLLERSRNLATDLALVFAEAIILRECEDKRDTVMRMVKKAMELCEERSDIQIRLRKEDAELIAPDETSHLKIIKDDTLKEPGFIIETNFGDIDGRISIQLDELRKELTHAKID